MALAELARVIERKPEHDLRLVFGSRAVRRAIAWVSGSKRVRLPSGLNRISLAVE
jgi:hypothetical protein